VEDSYGREHKQTDGYLPDLTVVQVIFIDLPVKTLYKSAPKGLYISLKKANKYL